MNEELVKFPAGELTVAETISVLCGKLGYEPTQVIKMEIDPKRVNVHLTSTQVDPDRVVSEVHSVIYQVAP